MMLTGKTIKPSKAKKMGLVDMTIEPLGKLLTIPGLYFCVLDAGYIFNHTFNVVFILFWFRLELKNQTFI